MRLKYIHFAMGSAVISLCAAMLLVLMTAVSFADDGSLLEPQHGIPLVIVNIDESEEGIAAAREADPKHQYGTIEDMDSSPNHSVRCVGSVQIKVPEGYEVPGEDISWIAADLKMDYIRGRGNSTWEGIPKHPYKIQLNEKADLFGMGKSKDWALMANYFDKSLMRNRIAYWLGAKLGMPYTPESVPVDVVMVGASGPVYLGCYELSETVKIEDSRVAMDKLAEQPDDTEAAGEKELQKTGGYLFSIFTPLQKDDPESNTFTTENGVELHFDNPEYMDEASLTDWQKEQRTYLREYVQKVEDLIVRSETIDLETHEKIDSLLDLRSVADYWLMQEFTINGDAYMTGSTYFYKPRGDKMYFGPLWDFDIAWGDLSDGDGDCDNYEGFNNTFMLWTDELRAKDPYFAELLKEEWAKLDPALAELTASGGTMDQFRNEIRAAYNADPVIAENEDQNIDTSVNNLRRWTVARRNWFDKNFDAGIGAVYATVTYVADGKTVFVNKKAKIGNAPDDNPAAPDKEGYFFVGWYTEDDIADADVCVEEDTVLYAKYVAAEDAVLPEALYLQDYELWAAAGSTLDVGSDYTILPSGVVSDRLTWTSGDESIATVDTFGIIHAHSAGDVTLTASTVNGIEGEILLHVVAAEALDPKDPQAIVFEKPEIKLEAGEHTQAKWHFVPEGEAINKDVYMFETSDDMVADVDRIGVIIANNPGTAEITMSVQYGDGESVSGTFKVIVTEQSAPADPDSPVIPDTPSSPGDKDKAAKGTIHKTGGNTYKILKTAGETKAGAVAFTKAANKNTVKVPDTVTINHRKYKVTQINAKAFKGKKIRTVTIGRNVKTIKKYAFKGSRATKLIIKSKKLTKASVNKSLTGSKVKTIKVKVGTRKQNKTYVNKYKKIFTRKNAGKKVTVG